MAKAMKVAPFKSTTKVAAGPKIKATPSTGTRKDATVGLSPRGLAKSRFNDKAAAQRAKRLEGKSL